MNNYQQVLDDILTEWVKDVPDGKPIKDSSYHLVILERAMDNIDLPDWFDKKWLLSELRGEKYIISEAKTNRTEDLHEIFFAIAFAGGKISKAKNLTQLKKIISSLGMLENKTKTIASLAKFNKEEPLFTKKDIALYKDATKIADKTRTYLSLNKLTPKKVSRVFGVGKGGTKMVADAIVKVKNGDSVSVSLKYGKGQFSSLSIPKLVEKMFGLNLDKGLLKDMYADGYDDEIEEAFYNYKLATYDVYDILETEAKGYTEEDKKAIEKSKFNMDSTWLDFMDTAIVPVKTRKAFTHLYNHPDNSGPRNVHKAMKGTLLNNAIDHYFESKEADLVENLEDALIYILRAEEDTNYLYVADGGKKFALIPSVTLIRGKSYTFNNIVKTDDDGVIKSADYTYDIEVKVDGTKAFTFNIKWRFAGQAGQWDGDLQHKGSKIEFHSGFSKVFGLPDIPKDMK